MQEMQDRLISDMKVLGIRDPTSIFYEYVLPDNNLMRFLYERHNRYGKSDNSQAAGGRKVRKMDYKFEDHNFVLFELTSDVGFDISIKRQNNIASPEFCLHIMIDRGSELAYIHNISYYIDCAEPELLNPGGGGVLLRLCLKYLKENHKRYKIKRIQLTDTSLLNCKPHKINVYLSMLHTLVYGDTWYGKYGFRPYDPDKNSVNSNLLRLYKKNKQIVRNTAVRHTTLYTHLYPALKKLNPDTSGREFDKIFDKLKDKTQDLTIGSFFKVFLANFDAKCGIFQEFYLDFATENGIYDFHGKTFYLDIDDILR